MFDTRRLSFCEDLYKNLSSEVLFSHYVENRGGYPVFTINGIELHGVHYKDKNEFENAWRRRCLRARKMIDAGAKVILFGTDAQLNDSNAIERFHRLPYLKVCFTVKTDVKYDEFLSIPIWDRRDVVGDLTEYVDLKGTRVFEKYFDCTSFINECLENSKENINVQSFANK